jgi:hypothetical protein
MRPATHRALSIFAVLALCGLVLTAVDEALIAQDHTNPVTQLLGFILPLLTWVLALAVGMWSVIAATRLKQRRWTVICATATAFGLIGSCAAAAYLLANVSPSISSQVEGILVAATAFIPLAAPPLAALFFARAR